MNDVHDKSEGVIEPSPDEVNAKAQAAQANQPRLVGGAGQASANRGDGHLTETFTLPARPSPADIMAFMKSVGRFLGLAAASSLTAGAFTPENGGCQALLASSANLIQTADNWRQFEMQREAALRGGMMPPQPPMPFRTH